MKIETFRRIKLNEKDLNNLRMMCELWINYNRNNKEALEFCNKLINDISYKLDYQDYSYEN